MSRIDFGVDRRLCTYGYLGRRWERKKFAPYFSPLGGPGAPQFFPPRGLPWRYLSSKFDAPTEKIGVRGLGNPF